MKEILDVIQSRRSIRNYKEQEPDTDSIKRILQAGSMAPSNGNSQPWEFILAKGEYRKNICTEFYNFSKEYIPKASYIPEDKKKIMLKYAKDLGGAPYHIIVTYPNLEEDIKKEQALKSSCAAIQNILLQAHAEGLGTVWVGSNLNQSEKVKEILNIPEDRLIAGIIPIGYPDITTPTPPRIAIKDKVKCLGF
ncbi:nitroreductase family protein [Ancylomarina sp. YFZ004]